MASSGKKISPNVGNLIVTGILVLSGVLLIALGAIGVHMYNNRENPSQKPRDSLERSRQAALFFIGTGIGSLIASLSSFVERFGKRAGAAVSIFSILIALTAIGIYSLVETGKLEKKLGNADAAHKITADLEAPQWVIVGLGLGYLVAQVIREIGSLLAKSKEAESEGLLLIGRIIGIYFLILACAAGGVNINIYLSSGKKDRSGLIFSSVILAFSIIAIIGVIVSLVFAPE